MSETLGKIKEVLTACGAWNGDAAWQVQGTWCIKHKALEIAAAAKGIAFDAPTIIEDNALERVSLVVTGHMGERSEWSIGECSTQNYKAFTNDKMAAYPWAMAEKRAKDRVILKLIGLHGYAYSEDEADDFKSARPAPPDTTDQGRKAALERFWGGQSYKLTAADAQQFTEKIIRAIKACPDETKRMKLIADNQESLDRLEKDNPDAHQTIMQESEARMNEFMAAAA